MSSSELLDIQTVLAGARDVALELSSAAVQAFEDRCDLTRNGCERLHYSACGSHLPGGECTANAMTVSECLGAECGSVQDFSNPVVRIPASLQSVSGNLTDPDVIEAICYGLFLDSQLIDQFEELQSPDGISSVFTYFGSSTGVTRVFPGANYDDECGEYDPRVRPWYVAASSGPKDVVIVLDISESMETNGRFDLVVDAVARVLATMNEHTFVNVVVFGGQAEVLTTESVLITATDYHKDRLLDLLVEVEFGNTTNFEQALNTTFNLLEESRARGEEASSECRTAILFLTDGTTADGLGADDPSEISNLVEVLNADIGAQIFAFALGPEADEDTLKAIACGTGGIFQAIPDGGSLSTAMSFYYRYYAIGHWNNTNYTAYSGLYELSAGTGGELRFTVASPAYDQAFDPPAFLGVSGVDFTLKSFLDLGFSLHEVVDAVFPGGKECPYFSMTDCQLQQFRGSISTESVCADGGCDTNSTSREPVQCMEGDEYPDNLWFNVDLAGLSYVDRNCCGNDTFDPSIQALTCEIDNDSGSNGDSNGAFGGMGDFWGYAVIAVSAFLFLSCCAWWCTKATKDDRAQ